MFQSLTLKNISCVINLYLHLSFNLFSQVTPEPEAAAAETPSEAIAADTAGYPYQKFDGPSELFVSHPNGPFDFYVQKEEV